MEQLVDNRYEIVEPLGSGGMADVFLAHDSVLDRDVALKVMNSRYASDDEFVERFRREAQSAAALSHPNIVSIYDRGVSDQGTYYIAMEYLSGGTLKDRILKRGPLPPKTAAAVTVQIAEALRAAHDRGMVHRDIKPHNILVTSSGDIKVTDFGIARAASSSKTIPEVQTDFVFSAIASELGLLGATAILLAFLVFVYRGIKISLVAGDDGSKLLAYGLTVMFAIQTIVIVGGVTKAIPLTGITLPFVSYGGSSVVGNFIIAGLLLVISARARFGRTTRTPCSSGRVRTRPSSPSPTAWAASRRAKWRAGWR